MPAPSATAPSSPADSRDAVTRRIDNEVYQRLAFTSFVIWTGGTLLGFILFAAPSPKPVFPAMISMFTTLIPAFLVWLAYKPLVAWRVAREMRADTAISV